MVNFLILGSEAAMQHVFTTAGWVKVDSDVKDTVAARLDRQPLQRVLSHHADEPALSFRASAGLRLGARRAHYASSSPAIICAYGKRRSL